MCRFLFSLILVFSCSVALAQGTEPLPVTRVTLYTSGVGYFERTGMVTDNSSSTLYFPLGQVNDVLKSLVLLDYSGGTIEPVTYGAQDPVNKQLQAFSIDLSDDPNEATLLDRLRGAEVTVAYVGGSPAPVSGSIVGVETKTIQLDDKSTTTESSLNLMTADSLVSIPLKDIASLQIDDPALRDEIKEALAVVAEGRDSSKRPVAINFSGKGNRKVLVGYLVQTPLWQTTYRLILGKKPYLQGWALVQNTSQDDWNNVSLSLVAGRPISFVQDLYTPVYVDRPVVQPEVIGSPTPQTYSSNLAIDNSPTSTFSDSSALQPPPEVPATTPFTVRMSNRQVGVFGGTYSISGTTNGSAGVPNIALNSIAATGEKLGTSLFSYDIKVPVTVPRQKSAMIPFVGTDIEAEPVSIYDYDTQPDHPLTGARLTNTSGLHLMGGPITVFDDNATGGNGYVGDALIDDTEPGQVRLLSFAVDLAVDGSRDDYDDITRVTQVTVAKGVLNTSTVTDSKSVYTFKNNADQDRNLVVQHPYNGSNEKLVTPDSYAERTADHYRFDLQVPAHQSKNLIVVLELVNSQSELIVDTTETDLLTYIHGSGISQPMKDALNQVISLRHLVADTQRKIAANEAQSGQLSRDQDRIRKNMVVLDKSTELYKRYADELNTQETSFNLLAAEHNSLETELNQRQNDLSNFVATLSVN